MRIRVLLAWLAWMAPQAVPVLGQSVPDSIAAEGVPAVPEALVRELNRYQNIRSASFQGWESGRRALLILTRFGNTNQVHRVAFPGGARTQLTFFPDRVLGASARPPRRDGRHRRLLGRIGVAASARQADDGVGAATVGAPLRSEESSRRRLGGVRDRHR